MVELPIRIILGHSAAAWSDESRKHDDCVLGMADWLRIHFPARCAWHLCALLHQVRIGPCGCTGACLCVSCLSVRQTCTPAKIDQWLFALVSWWSIHHTSWSIRMHAMGALRMMVDTMHTHTYAHTLARTHTYAHTLARTHTHTHIHCTHALLQERQVSFVVSSLRYLQQEYKLGVLSNGSGGGGPGLDTRTGRYSCHHEDISYVGSLPRRCLDTHPGLLLVGHSFGGVIARAAMVAAAQQEAVGAWPQAMHDRFNEGLCLCTNAHVCTCARTQNTWKLT